MSNVCGRCKRPTSSHDNHASCPQCRIAAGECNLDVHDPCSICGGWTSKQWNRLRRSLVDARARASQRGRQHWTAAFPQLEEWIMSRTALSASRSGPASEISSLVSGDDFSDRLLVSTSSLLAQQDLVVQTQNGVNMASGTATTTPSMATTAPSTAPLPLTAGPSTIEPIVPIVAPLGAKDTPSVIQRARPVVSTEQTMQSTPGYGTLPYVSGPPYTAPLSSTAPLPYAAYTAPLPYAAMPAMSARPSLLQHQLIQERQQFEAWRASQAQPQPLVHRGLQLRLGTMLRPCQGGQPVLKGLDLKTRLQTKLKVPGLLQHLADPPLPRGTTLGGLAQPQGHLRPVLKGQSTGLLLPRNLEAFKADMTLMLSDMLQSSLSKFASQFKPISRGHGDPATTQTVASVPTVDVASDREDSPPGPEDQS